MSPVTKLNLQDAQDFSPVPDDEYHVSPVEFSEVKSGAKSQYITATLEITEGEYAGRKLFQNLMINGAGAGIFVDFINACQGSSYTVDEYRDEGIEIDTDDLIGAELIAVTKQEEYPEGSGDFRAQVKRVMQA